MARNPPHPPSAGNTRVYHGVPTYPKEQLFHLGTPRARNHKYARIIQKQPSDATFTTCPDAFPAKTRVNINLKLVGQQAASYEKTLVHKHTRLT